jgi:hypothetical protein
MVVSLESVLERGDIRRILQQSACDSAISLFRVSYISFDRLGKVMVMPNHYARPREGNVGRLRGVRVHEISEKGQLGFARNADIPHQPQTGRWKDAPYLPRLLRT